MTELKATINTMHSEMATVKASLEESNKKPDHVGIKGKRINLGMLHLLETLTLVSSQQQRQIKKMTESMQANSPNLHQLWTHVADVKNITEDRLKTLSQKVEHYVVQSERKDEKVLPIQEKLTTIEGLVMKNVMKADLYQDMSSVLSNISHKVIIMKYIQLVLLFV